MASQLPLFGYIVAFIIGTFLGSFANVCIHRLPRRQSIVFPGSHCPFCHQAIRPWQNIPLLSYAFLGGRCAACKSPIAWRYPLVELCCGLLYVWLYHQFGFSAQSVVFALLAVALVIVSWIDLAHTIIPDTITLPGIIAGVVASVAITPVGLSNALVGIGLGGGLFFLVAVLSRGGMGGGDIKLIAMIGAFLGWRAVLVTILLGALSGAIVGVALILLKQKRRKDPVPFGPFLALGALLAMVWGEELLAWYWHLSP
jgi:leader peptidase (prepilin peptidase)/N-methyltransferase